MKREYPLFIIDDSREHGRGHECDYIACTDSQCPFTAIVELHTEGEYRRMYDRMDYATVWSEPSGGIRKMISVVSTKPEDKERTKTLLKRALKELIIRSKVSSVDYSNVTPENVLHFVDILSEQYKERVRDIGINPTDTTVMAILMKIKKDYEQI